MAKLKSKRRYSRNKNRKKSTKRRTRKRTKKQRGSGNRSAKKKDPQLDEFGIVAKSMGVDVEARAVVGELYNVVDNPGEKEGVQVELSTLRSNIRDNMKNHLNNLYYLIPDYYATADTYKDANGDLDTAKIQQRTFKLMELIESVQPQQQRLLPVTAVDGQWFTYPMPGDYSDTDQQFRSSNLWRMRVGNAQFRQMSLKDILELELHYRNFQLANAVNPNLNQSFYEYYDQQRQQQYQQQQSAQKQADALSERQKALDAIEKAQNKSGTCRIKSITDGTGNENTDLPPPCPGRAPDYKAKRKLQLLAHPDKNTGCQDDAKIVFQYIGNECFKPDGTDCTTDPECKSNNCPPYLIDGLEVGRKCAAAEVPAAPVNVPEDPVNVQPQPEPRQNLQLQDGSVGSSARDLTGLGDGNFETPVQQRTIRRPTRPAPRAPVDTRGEIRALRDSPSVAIQQPVVSPQRPLTDNTPTQIAPSCKKPAPKVVCRMCGNEGFNDPKCKCCPGSKQAEEAIATATPQPEQPQPEQKAVMYGVNENTGARATSETVGRCRKAVAPDGSSYWYNSENKTTRDPNSSVCQTAAAVEPDCGQFNNDHPTGRDGDWVKKGKSGKKMKAQCVKTRGCFVQHHKPSNRFRCRSVKKRKKKKKRNKKTRKKKTICADDSGCPEGQRCGSDNFCAPRLNITEITTPQPEQANIVQPAGVDVGLGSLEGFCEKNTDCPENEECKDNQCVPVQPGNIRPKEQEVVQIDPKPKGDRWKTAKRAMTSGMLHGDAVRMGPEIPESTWRTGKVLKGHWAGQEYAYNNATGDYIIWSQHVNQIDFDNTVAERAWQVYPGSRYSHDEAGNFVPQEGEVWYYNRAENKWSQTLPAGVEFDADEVHQLSTSLYGREHDLEGDVPHSHGESQGDGKTEEGDTIDGRTGEIIRRPQDPTTSGQKTDSIASVAEKRAEESVIDPEEDFYNFLKTTECPKLTAEEITNLASIFD